MSRTSQFLLKLAISAMMALPVPLQAQQGLEPSQPASTTDGVPVAFTVIPTGDSLTYISVAPIRMDQEQAVATELATHNAAGTLVLVDGADDPVLGAIKKSGFLSRVKVFVANAKQLPAKLNEQVKKVTDYAKREKAGLLWSFYNAGVMGTTTYLASSRADAGLAVLAGLFMWNSFIMTKSQAWEKILEKGGNGLTELTELCKPALEQVGVELNHEAKKYFEAFGHFGVAWAANFAVATHVLFNSGHLHSWAQALFAGLLINYNVWDMAILRKVRSGAWDSKWIKPYFAFQFAIGSLAEAAMYAGAPAAEWILGATVLSGLTYLIHQEKIDNSLTARARVLKEFFTRSPAIKKCEMLLNSKGVGIWEDIQ